MKKLLLALFTVGLSAASLPGHTRKQPGYWTVTTVPALSDWVDWVEVVDSSGEYGVDINTGDLGARGEQITSYFGESVGGTHNLHSRSEGPIRLKFEWHGGGTVPSSVTYDYWMEAQAWIQGNPGTFAVDFYYVVVWDNSGPVLGSVISSSSSHFAVFAEGEDTFTVPSGGLSVFYTDPPGFINSMKADCQYNASVTTMSSVSVNVHP